MKKTTVLSITIFFASLFCFSFIFSGQVKPLLPDTTKGQLKPIAIEEPQVKKVYAKGVASVFEGNIENARKAALRHAYSEAVSQACGLEIGSMSLIRNVKYVSDIVISRSRGFIRTYTILSEGISIKDPNKYAVFIEAEVIEKGKSSEGEIDGLRLYLEILGNPRILIILPEEHVEFGTPSSLQKEKVEVEFQDRETQLKILRETSQRGERSNDMRQRDSAQSETLRNAETALAQAFSRYGYQVVTSDDLAAEGLCKPEDLDKARTGATVKIVEIARAAGIDLALFGKMTVSTELTKPAGIEMIKVVAEATAKSIIVSTGRLIEALHYTTQTANFSPLSAYSNCLDNAASGIANVLAWKIPQILSDTYCETRLTLSPLDLNHADELRVVLKGVIGVEDVQFAKIPTAENPKAEYIILSGFIPPNIAEIIAICEQKLNARIAITKSSKFETEGKVDKSN